MVYYLVANVRMLPCSLAVGTVVPECVLQSSGYHHRTATALTALTFLAGLMPTMVVLPHLFPLNTGQNSISSL
jgi:Na+/melibiose symporter-like transporter